MRPRSRTSPSRVQHFHGALVDGVGGTLSRDGYEQVLLAVVVGQWRGTGFVGGHAHLDRFRLVIFALNQLAPAVVAHPFRLCGFGLDMVDGLAFLASAAAAQTCDDGLQGQLIAEYGIELDLLVRQEFGQRQVVNSALIRWLIVGNT